MKRVATAANPLHARLILALLEENGVRAVIQGEALWGARGELPFTSDSAPSVWVNEADVPRAMQLIALQEQGVNPARCPHCGYDLRSLSQPRCPECGQTFLRTQHWRCKECNELSTEQFTECWKCGEPRGDAPVDASPTSLSNPSPELLDGETTQGAADPDCMHCYGSGVRQRPILPLVFLVFGVAFFSVMAHNIVMALTYQSAAVPYLIFQTIVMGGVVSLVGWILRNKTCECTTKYLI